MRQKSFNKKTGFVMAAVAALTLAFGITSAEAGGRKNKHHGYKSYGWSHGKYYGKHYKKRHNKRHKYRRGSVVVLGPLSVLGWVLHDIHGHYPNYNLRQWQPQYVSGYQNGCTPVSKIGRWHGHRAQIGGTACVNAYGNYYVINGSRYLIRYLY